MALQFVDENSLQTIDLGDETWVKIPTVLSFGFITAFSEVEGGDGKKIANMIVKVIKEWSAKSIDGSMLPITEENVLKMDAKSTMRIMQVITPMTDIEKKS